MVDMYVHPSYSSDPTLLITWGGVGQANRTDAQTGVSDIPLTANGERMVKEMAPRMVGEKSTHPHFIESLS
jgi:broad specificity phosphatase PhoE